MIERLLIATSLRAQIEDEARAGFPRECCGLLVGHTNDGAAEIFLAHPALNIAERDDRFEIDPQAQFTLLRALRGTGREIIGCYHSHPNGVSEPSPRDLAAAGEAGFVWLIAALGSTGACALNAFVFDHGGFEPLEIREPLSA
ncbi:MAG TPA: M67 family metallopeptidase [Rhizomicrobium sp.]